MECHHISHEMTAQLKSRKTIIEMLTDRGYDTSDVSSDDDNEIVVKRGNSTIVAMWPADANIGTIQSIATRMEDEGLKRIIIVVDCSVTPHSMTAIKDLAKQKYIIEIFTVKELQFNWSKNVLVPQHTLCSADERADILTKYSLNPKQLPQMKKTDAMARYLGVGVGQIVKIVAESSVVYGTKVVSYRLVVA